MDTPIINQNGEDLSPEMKESMRKDILSKLFDKNSSLSPEMDTDILRMVLIEDRKLSEVGDELKLTPLEVSQFFYRALRRVSLRFATFNMQVENATDWQGEILFLRSKLQRYERKENKVLELPFETKKLLFQSVRNMGFSNRVWNILHAHDIEILADLVKLTKYEFSRCRGVGKGSLKEVNDFLLSEGLNWGMDI